MFLPLWAIVSLNLVLEANKVLRLSHPSNLSKRIALKYCQKKRDLKEWTVANSQLGNSLYFLGKRSLRFLTILVKQHLTTAMCEVTQLI